MKASPRAEAARLERLADEELMAHVDRKDPHAFEVLYDRHGGAAYSLAYRIVGDRNAAEDVAQEAFLSIWRSNARFDRARGSVRSWVLSVVRNRAIDALRRGGGGAPKLDHDDDAVLEARPGEELTEEEALRRETSRELRGALDSLPEDQSQVIQLAYFGGFSHSEIAEMLSMPLGTVKGRMRLGLEKIRAQIAESITPDGVLETI
ncbi:MAG: sigma-70 family RNA polymerase sigma factor [Solirubrobacterales bacterium]|nr:sigma-70 family RNA polymerase sigma factor [Solirubrobacterales bacterium]